MQGLMKIAEWFGKLLPWQRPALAREDITELLIDTISNDASDVDSHEGMLLKNILGLRDLTATDVMVPRADIISVDIEDDGEQILARMSEVNHSRVPVVRGSLDEVVGILHIKDLVRALREDSNQQLDIKAILRKPIYIAPSMRLLDLLQEMRLQRLHLALVVDEFGGTDGLITIEDLVEEIVGEIEDEHDETVSPRFERQGEDSAVADARLAVEQLEEVVGPLLEEDERDEIDTIGGLVFALAGQVPGRGEVIRHPAGIEFLILESDPRHISLVRISGLGRSRQRSQQAPAIDAIAD